ncbi:MAG: PKD domain-containing protein [Bacteroidales bacterium]
MKKKSRISLLLVSLLLAIVTQGAVINVPADYSTIQLAIDAAQSGDTIVLANGTYVENLSLSNKSLVIASQFIYSRNPADVDATIIKNGAQPTESKSILYVSGLRTYRLELVGLTISDGVNSRALYVSGYSTLVSNVKFSNNSAGAIHVWDGDARIASCIFTNNDNTMDSGGAVYLQMSNEDRNIQVDSCVFSNNSTPGNGGAIYSTVYKSKLRIIGNTIFENSANRGGAISLSLGTLPDVLVSRNVMYGNVATVEGGAVYVSGRSSRFVNNTIVNNRLSTHGDSYKGGAMYFKATNSYTYVTLINNIIKANTFIAADKEVYLNFSDAATNSAARISYCNITENADDYSSANANATVEFLDGNITSDPLFIDVQSNDFSLQQNSPCIDAGAPDVLGDGSNWQTDPEDQDPDGTRLDIGAIPYIDDTPTFMADFSFTQIDTFAPSEVLFNDMSKVINSPAITSWSWDFGDGTSSTEENPMHCYSDAGTYNVSLTISNGANTDTKVVSEAITVLGVEDGYYTQLINLPMEQTLVAGQLTGYSENNVPFTIAKAIYPNFTELDGDPVYSSNGDEYWGHQARFEFDLTSIDGEIVEVAAEVADNNGGTMLVIYSESTAIYSNQVGCADPNYCSKFQWFSFKPESSQQPTKVVFSSFEGGISTLRIKVKKPKLSPSLDISVYAATCNQYFFSPIIENAPLGNLKYQWFLDGSSAMEDASYFGTFDAGEHEVCLKVFVDDSSIPFVEKCVNFKAETISTSLIYTYYPVEKRVEMAGRVTSSDSVNYHWTYGDGEYGDGSLSVEHTYTNNGTYYPTFVATSINNNGCFANSSVEIVVSDVSATGECENNRIEGVFDTQLASVNLNDFEVELYKIEEASLPFLWSASSINPNNGQFIFENIPSGNYCLRGIVNNPESYPSLLIGYFNELMNRVVTWQQASPIVLTCHTSANLDLSMAAISAILSGGNASISGLIVYGDSESEGVKYSTGVNDQNPCKGATIMLMNQNDDVLSVTYSSDGGGYRFSELPSGNYKLLVDIVGLNQSTTHEFTITSGNETYSNLNFIVDTLDLLITATTSTVDVNVDKMESNTIKVFPNPFVDNTMVSFVSSNDQNGQLWIYSATGVEMYHRSIHVVEGVNSIPISIRKSGVYILKIQIDKSLYRLKVIRY